jgi:hypothetical protein
MFIVRDGVFSESEIVETFMKAGPYPGCKATKRLDHNLSDLKAQCSACAVGTTQLHALFDEYGKAVVHFFMKGKSDSIEDGRQPCCPWKRVTMDSVGSSPRTERLVGTMASRVLVPVQGVGEGRVPDGQVEAGASGVVSHILVAQPRLRTDGPQNASRGATHCARCRCGGWGLSRGGRTGDPRRTITSRTHGGS